MDKRLFKIKTLLKKRKLDAILISSVPNITYLTNYSAFSYFEREVFLLVAKNKNYLITDGRYSEAVLGIPGFQLLEISDKNSIGDIFKLLSQRIKKLGIEDADISLSESKKLKKYFKISAVKELKNLRIIKDGDEISKIKKACDLGDETFQYILKKIKKGVSEKEIAFEIEFFIKKQGADISFPPIVAFSKNSSIPHHKTSDRKLKTDNIILLDFGTKYQNYCSDMTRTVFFGKPDKKFKTIYKTVIKAQEKAISLLYNKLVYYTSTNIRTSEIDNVARTHIIKCGFPSIPHSLGHGIGIEVHEAPRLSPKSKDVLKPGMIFSIEPGIYIPGYGGVRIEDLVLVKKDNVELLTHSPKKIIEI